MNATAAHTFSLTVTAPERDELLSLLEQALHDARIEEHRTDSLNYRQLIGTREAILEVLVEKLRRLA